MRRLSGVASNVGAPSFVQFEAPATPPVNPEGHRVSQPARLPLVLSLALPPSPSVSAATENARRLPAQSLNLSIFPRAGPAVLSDLLPAGALCYCYTATWLHGPA